MKDPGLVGMLRTSVIANVAMKAAFHDKDSTWLQHERLRVVLCLQTMLDKSA